MARFHRFQVGDLARVLTLRDMIGAYEYATMPDGTVKQQLYTTMRQLTNDYANEIGHIKCCKNGLVQMDYHCHERWFHDWMLIPTQVLPFDESEARPLLTP